MHSWKTNIWRINNKGSTLRACHFWSQKNREWSTGWNHQAREGGRRAGGDRNFIARIQFLNNILVWHDNILVWHEKTILFIIFFCIKGFVFDLPSGSTAFDHVLDIALIYLDVCYPAIFVCGFALVYNFECKKIETIRFLRFI